MKTILKNKKLSLVIPCYNEEKTIKVLVETVIHSLSEKIGLELLIADDASADNSYKQIVKLQKKYPDIIKCFALPKNSGKGAAVRYGIRFASGDYVGIQDADMEYLPSNWLILLRTMFNNHADVVFGSRYLRPSDRRVLYFWHTIMNKFLTFFSNIFTNLDITDMETCYKLFDRKVLHKILTLLCENRFGFEPEITQIIAREKCAVYECAIEYHPRSYEEGKKTG